MRKIWISRERKSHERFDDTRERERERGIGEERETDAATGCLELSSKRVRSLTRRSLA